MKIAILDSGVDCNHPMFVGKDVTVYLVDKKQHKNNLNLDMEQQFMQ